MHYFGNNNGDEFLNHDAFDEDLDEENHNEGDIINQYTEMIQQIIEMDNAHNVFAQIPFDGLENSNEWIIRYTPAIYAFLDKFRIIKNIDNFNRHYHFMIQGIRNEHIPIMSIKIMN